MSISMIKVSNVDFTDIDVDSLVKSTKATFTIFLGIRERKACFMPSQICKICNHVTVSQKKISLLFDNFSIAPIPSMM